MAKIIGAVDIDRERCKGCDLCVVACPCSVLALETKDVNDVAPEACIGCAACATVCPDGCITVYRVVEK